MTLLEHPVSDEIQSERNVQAVPALSLGNPMLPTSTQCMYDLIEPFVRVPPVAQQDRQNWINNTGAHNEGQLLCIRPRLGQWEPEVPSRERSLRLTEDENPQTVNCQQARN